MKIAPLVMVFFGMVLPSQAAAQEDQPPTPEEYAAKAAAAEAAPLFSSDEPLVITLRTDIKWLRDVRSDSTETDGTVIFTDLDGSSVERPVEVRTRGNWRRDKRNCRFPPLRLDLPRSQMEGTVFEGQDKLKLVTPCHDSRDDYQRYVLKEYLVYRAYQRITPLSFRTRLVEITYEDTSEDYETRTKLAFLIESDEQMAERNGAVYQDVEQFHPARMDAEAAVIASVFNFMVGFTDVSQTFFHNSKLIRTEDGRYIPVGYDFDFSGAVNARYASPDPSLGLRRVTDRAYRGFCRPELDREWIAGLFLARRDAIRAEYESFDLLEEDRVEDMLEYYDDFYEILENEGRFERYVVRACRNWS